MLYAALQIQHGSLVTKCKTLCVYDHPFVAYTYQTIDCNCPGFHMFLPMIGPGSIFRDQQHYLPLASSGIDISRIRKWVSHCETEHAECHSGTPFELVTRPTMLRLIDVDNLCIVEDKDCARYLSLSYVWGQGVPSIELNRETIRELFTPGSLEILSADTKIPATIVDAMVLTKSLGIRYLWVDRLCIV